ncbi:MAG: flagellar motor switch protein FliG, partial [Myxococcota bacterium]
MEFEKLRGSEKAAVLVLTLPDQEVHQVIEALDDNEIERILAAVARFEDVPTRVQERVVAEFRENAGKRELTLHGGRDRAHGIARSVLESDRADRILERLGRDERRIEWTLRGYSPAFIAETISSQHPQTIALMISQVPAGRGAEIIEALPEEMRADILLRLAELESVTTEVMAELEQGVVELFQRPSGAETRVGGPDIAASLLKRVSKTDEESMLDGLEERAPELAGAIRNRMLTFNDLEPLQPRDFQALLREISSDKLALALKTATDEMRDKVFGSISKRAGDQLREELDLLGPTRLSEVEQVQQE